MATDRESSAAVKGGAPPEATQVSDGLVASLVDVDVAFKSPGTEDINLAVRDVSMSVKPGEFLVLVGRSGCGKTTVLNLLAGLLTPTRGQVSVLGRAPIEARSHIAYMFARDALLPWRSARRNVEFALELRRPELRRRARRERAQTFLDMLGVGQGANRYPWQLSQGMRQRVAIARTWAIDPDVLLMDEPFAALDAQTRAETQQTFLDIWSRDRKTVIFVTHDLDEAIVMGDRVVVMDAGRMIDDVRVTIPRPRHALTVVEQPDFGTIHHRLVQGITTGKAGGSTHNTGMYDDRENAR